MKIFNNFFKSDMKTEVSEVETQGKVEENGISFILNEDNSPIVRITVNDTSKNKAKFFAEHIFLATHGAYQISIIDILDALGKDPAYTEFVKDVYDCWSELLDKTELGQETNIDAPLVSPRTFAKLVLQAGKND